MLALGCQKITREALRAGIAAGISLVDTALAYGNEAMIGEAGAPYIVTKGGLGTDWVPDGRARSLAEAARASRERLGRIDLYLLHAIDPKVPLATSVRALARLREEGIVGAIGVANVNLGQLEEALAITAIDAIEIPLGIHQLDQLHLVEACERRGIRVLAYRPFGGATGVKKVLKDPLLRELGAPCEVALAFLRGLSPVVIPLPGATRIATAESCARRVELSAEAMAALRTRFLGGAPAPARDGEVVMIMGMPGAGKSTVAARFAGYTRLNRDERGGTLKQLAEELAATLDRGETRVVLDNTYATRSSRAQVVRIAQRHGVAVRCIVLATSLEDAQRNAAARILERYDRLLEPAELVAENQIGPGAQFRYRRQCEPPRLEEGFAALEEIAFERAPEPDGAPAAIVELDGLVWEGRPRAQISLVPGARDRIAEWGAQGYRIAATTWQPEPFDPAIDDQLRTAVGDIQIARCIHPPGPPVCWCRKPLPGLALLLARRHGFSLARSVHVGRGPADRGFAQRAGLHFVEASWT